MESAADLQKLNLDMTNNLVEKKKKLKLYKIN